MESKSFDYENYIRERLKEIPDLDERRFAKELLIGNLGKIFAWTEEKYEALEHRVQNEIDIPWKNFGIYTTVIQREDYDPINDFWFPVCEEDMQTVEQPNYQTIYLMAEDRICEQFFEQKILIGVDEENDRTVQFKIELSDRYQDMMELLYELFVENHIPWQTIHMGHLERFFDLIPIEDIQVNQCFKFNFGEWDPYIKQGVIPLWNIHKTEAHSSEYRLPCIDTVYYEHICYLPDSEGSGKDGYLVKADEDILSIRHEENKILLRTKEESLGDIFIYRVNQTKQGEMVKSSFPVLSNCKKDNLSARYLQQTGRFIQTPMELYRKIEDMSGEYKINILGYEITNEVSTEFISGDMNRFFENNLFFKDKRNILLFRIQKKMSQEHDYLYESQIRYILTQLQMEFFEYRCMGVMV